MFPMFPLFQFILFLSYSSVFEECGKIGDFKRETYGDGFRNIREDNGKEFQSRKTSF